ncbi:MAG: TonB-dependent receptor [Hyphomonas sp.]|uniref:TonB-dependent receptor plug domain-containing protein n=1 Tax=Hyphomonas sp. TaxID=87 RepID=UPI0035284ECF
MSLETVEVTGFTPLTLDAVTGSVSVLTEDDLAVRAAPNLADALRAVPGVAVSRSGGVGGLTQLRMRGAEANHTLVLFDGFEVSDPVTGEVDFGLLTALPAARVEVLRGEASSIHGSDAIGGVVDILPSSASGWIGLAEAGNRDTLNGRLGWNGEQFGAVLSGFRTDGVDVSGQGGEADSSDALSGLLRGQAEIAPGWMLGGLALVRRSTSQFDTDLDFDGRLDDADRETEADQSLLGVSLNGAIAGIDQSLRASYGEVSRDNTSETGLLDSSTGKRTRVSWIPSVSRGAHGFAGLAEYEREEYERADVQYGGQTDASEEFETLGLAGEYRFTTDQVSLSASVRHDDNDGRFDDATTWRLGGAYQVAGAPVRLRASAGKGVKNPTFTELFGFFPGSFVGNRDLKPETSVSWEAGFDLQAGPAVLAASYFSAELEDEIYTAFNPDFTSTARNRTGRSERSGIELAGRWPVSDALTVSGQLTLTDSSNDTGVDEIRVPSETASVALLWQPDGNGWQAGLALDYVGEQDDFDFGTFPETRVTLDSYVLVSGRFEYPLTERISLTLRGENLLDEEAVDVFGYAAPGAAGYVGLKLR